MSDTSTAPTHIPHGAERLPSVNVTSYNVELKDNAGFIGDRASKGAFRKIVDDLRKAVRKEGEDPLGDDESEDISKAEFDQILAHGDLEAAGLIQGAIEEFSQEFAAVIRRFLKLKEWKDVERIAIGGGFRGSRIGELVIGRTTILLKEDKIALPLVPIHNDPDEAGLIGALHLAPSWMFQAFDGVLAVDIGGTNMRAGIVQMNLKKSKNLSKAKVSKLALWRHGDEEEVGREQAVAYLTDMLKGLISAARKKKFELAPFIGIGCPGIIEQDGSIDRGAQNLPGNWASRSFHLPSVLHDEIPKIGDHETMIVMHNDAVVQGLSETPHMADVERWGIFTIGTGLGNAVFQNREE